jgi:lipopolysaccharide-induced tumor necrosis factor-alpha factor
MQQYEGDDCKYPKIPKIQEPPIFTSAPPPPSPTAIPNVYIDPGRYDTMTSFTQIHQPPSHSQQPTTIIHYATPAILSTAPRTEPVLVNCPKCFKLVTTNPEPVTGLLTWISCIALCFIGCCCIPFFTKSFKDVRHRCPACNHIIARYERL